MIPENAPPDDFEQKESFLGGMAVVYRAIHKKTGQSVAIKYLSKQYTDNPRVVESFEREADTLKALKHPNIVRFISSGVHQERRFLIMEFLQGKTLELVPRLRVSDSKKGSEEKDLPLEHLLTLFLQILKALGFAHQKNIIHRDLKPENIFVLGDPRDGTASTKLIDFGIADSGDGEEEDIDTTVVVTQNAFTLPYASPEQVTSRPTNALSDLFSIGVVLYEKLTGCFPFNGKNQVEIFLQHMRGDIKPIRLFNKSIPKKLQDIVFKALQKEEADRFQSAEEFYESLETFQKSFIQGKQALTISPFATQVRNNILLEHEGGQRRRSVIEESRYLKQVLTQYNLMSRKLKLLQGREKASKEKLQELKVMCKQLSLEHERVKSQLRMCFGFISEPLVLEKTSSVFRCPIRFWEKRGNALSLQQIEYFLTFSDDTPIKTGNHDFTLLSRKTIRFQEKDKRLPFSSWEESHWWFQPYEEKVFYLQLQVCPKFQKPPEKFQGIAWTYEFFNAIKHFGKNSIRIHFNFSAVDQNEKRVFASHAEDVIFGTGLYEL